MSHVFNQNYRTTTIEGKLQQNNIALFIMKKVFLAKDQSKARRCFRNWKLKTLMNEWHLNQSTASRRSNFMNDSHNLKNVLANIRQGSSAAR